MRYMLLIYTQEDAVARRSVEEMTKVKEAHRAVMSDARSRGILEGAEPLRPTRTARTVRTHNGKLLTSDGPFAETKEQLAGYYILNCKDLDEAIAWAARIPSACGGMEGCVEVRELEWQPAPAEVLAGTRNG